MIIEEINSALAKPSRETAPAIFNSLPGGQSPNFPVRVQIDFLSFVAIAKPGRRDAGYDVVVVDPAKGFELHVVNVPAITDTRAAVSVQSTWVRADVRQSAAAGANGSHGG